MFGVLTEGVRHFNHYIPSPRSRIRAFEDLGACVAEILAATRERGTASLAGRPSARHPARGSRRSPDRSDSDRP